MLRFRLILLAALLAAAIVLMLVGTLHRQRAELLAGKDLSSASEPTLNRPAVPSRRAQSEGDMERSRRSARGFSTGKHAAKNKIANDYILRFRNADDLQAFLALARTKGIKVIGSIANLNAVRVQVSNPDEMLDLWKESPVPFKYANNSWVFIPEIPRTDPSQPEGNYAAFGQNATTWLGVPEQHAGWGKGITIAVIDTGVEDHPDLAGVPITRVDLVNGAASVSGDYEGHATAVASILAGALPEAPGVAPAASLLSIRVAGGDGVGDSFTVAQAIVEAADSGAQVINLSLGSQGDNPVMQQAVDYALQKNVLIVAAVGNDGIEGVDYPARYDGVIAVTGVDANGQHLYFDNLGSEVMLAAPGFGIDTAWSGDQMVDISGTSTAAPFVAGALAAVLSQNPQMSGGDALALLVQHARDLGAPGRNEDYGFGVLDLKFPISAR